MNHFQHDTLLKQDVNVVRVSSWLIAESMKGAPGILRKMTLNLQKSSKRLWPRAIVSLSLVLVVELAWVEAQGLVGAAGVGILHFHAIIAAV